MLDISGKAELVLSSGGRDLYFIPLPMVLNGFGRFLNSWLLLDRLSDTSVLVDTGPASTFPILEEAIGSLGVEKIDYLVLTHVHLDHGGGAGHFMVRFPEARVIVSPRGVKHLIDPSRLWEGSLSVLGATAEAYGKPIPIPSAVIADYEKEKLPMEIMQTPGHASHHISCICGDILFAGEAAGVYLPVPDKNGIYIRPATPPPFRMDVSLSSLDLLSGRDVSVICYGHCGYSEKPAEAMQLHREQLLLWEREIGNILNERSYVKDDGNLREITEICLEKLSKEDPLLVSLNLFPNDVSAREKYFLGNSIRGFIGYLS